MGGLSLEFGRDISFKNKTSEIYMYYLLFSMYILIQLNRKGICNLEETESRSTASYPEIQLIFLY